MEGWGTVLDGALRPHFHQGAAEGTDTQLHSGSLGDGAQLQDGTPRSAPSSVTQQQ